jgi:hypothetical protein
MVGQVRAEHDMVVQGSLAGAVSAGKNSTVNDRLCGVATAILCTMTTLIYF